MSRVKFLPFGLWLPDHSAFEPGTLRTAENFIRLHGQWRLVRADNRLSEVTLGSGDVSKIHKVHCHIIDIASKQRLKPTRDITKTNFNNDYQEIDEDYFDDAEFVFSDGDPTNAIYRTKLSLVEDPPNSDHVFYFRYRIWNLDAGAKNEDIARRLEHMRIAVDHLNQAGLHDIAEHVTQRAEAAERELHEHRQGQGGDVMHEIMKQLDGLRHEVGRLRDEVNELKEKR